MTSSGIATLPMPDLTEAENFTITISNNGYIPYQIEVELPAGSQGTDYLLVIGMVAAIALVFVIASWYRMKKP